MLYTATTNHYFNGHMHHMEQTLDSTWTGIKHTANHYLSEKAFNDLENFLRGYEQAYLQLAGIVCGDGVNVNFEHNWQLA